MNMTDFPWKRVDHPPKRAGRYLVVFADLFNKEDMGTCKYTREDGWAQVQDFQGRYRGSGKSIRLWTELPEIPK